MEIDVARLLHEYRPALAGRLPHFAVAALRRLLHEREINDLLSRYGGLPPQRFLSAVLDDMRIGRCVWFEGGIRPDGRYLFASNHPFGGLDGMAVAEVLAETFGDVRVVVNRMLAEIGPLRGLWLPLGGGGRLPAVLARRFEEVMRGNVPVLIFPAGLCSRRRHGVVSDPDWKPRFVRRAIESGRAVVPVHVDGRLSDRFYRAASLRRALGIGTRLEALLLVDEMFRQRGTTVRIAVGRPVAPDELLSFGSAEAACLQIRERVCALHEKMMR